MSTVCRAMFLILSASFTSAMLTCKSWFQCTDDITLGLSRVSGSMVFAFPAISCRTSTYYEWSFLMAACIVFWLVIIGLVLLWRLLYRRQLAVIQKRITTTSTSQRESHSNLTALVPLIPQTTSNKEVLSLFVPFINHTSFTWYWPAALIETAATATFHDEPVCGAEMSGEATMETRREYAFRSVYGALFDSFTADAIGWTIVILVRRLVLIMLSVTLTVMPAIKNMSFVFLHVIIGIVHAHYHPYSSATLNQAEIVAILVHLVVQYCC